MAQLETRACLIDDNALSWLSKARGTKTSNGFSAFWKAKICISLKITGFGRNGSKILASRLIK